VHRVLRLTLLSALVVCLGSAPAAAAPAKAVIREFRTPSGNIGCVFSSGLDGAAAPTVRCDIRSRLRPAPKQPANCPLDYGDSVQVERSGHAILVCHGDTAIDPHARVLAYGHQFRRDGITCVSQTAGLTCTNASGHGYFLSRQSWRVF
jgi:hypothetical protein